MVNAAAQDVRIEKQGANFVVKAAKYEARVEADGCMTSLKLGGAEFLKPGVDISRGVYFYQKGSSTLKLSDVKQSGTNAIEARSDKAAIRYEFSADSMKWTAANLTAAPMSFYIVFDPSVNEVDNGEGETARPPIRKNWKTSVWHCGAARLRIQNGTNIWGPWSSQALQVCEATLGANEKREIVVSVGDAKSAPAAKAPAPAQTTGVSAQPQAAPAQTSGNVKTELKDGIWIIQAPKYEARVEPDGCMTSLKVDGAEFLKPGVGISRGAYFHISTALKLTDIKRTAANTIEAKGEQAAIKYVFNDAAMKWTVTNSTDAAMRFFLVFDPAVSQASDGKSAPQPTPLKNNWKDSVWYCGKAKLAIQGSTRLWGPFAGPHQVWELTLAAKETREISLRIIE